MTGVHCLLAVGVNGDGHREILGLDVVSSEDGTGWLAFFRGLVARGLSGVRLVTSDAHRGLVNAIGATLPDASWQRCRTYYPRDLLVLTPRSSQPWVATVVRTIFDQADANEVVVQFDRVLDGLTEKLPRAAEHLSGAKADLLAFTAYPREIWRQIWSSNPQERLNKDIRRRTDVVGIFPDRGAIIRLVGAVLAEQHDEWIATHRYLGVEVLAKVDAANNPSDTPEIGVTPEALAAQPSTRITRSHSPYTTPPDVTLPAPDSSSNRRRSVAPAGRCPRAHCRPAKPRAFLVQGMG
ncbi:transposase [Frankia sp. AgKG'84/4]